MQKQNKIIKMTYQNAHLKKRNNETKPGRSKLQQVMN